MIARFDPKRGTTPLDNLLLALLVAVVLGLIAARYLHITIDPPYGIVSQSGTFLTDEGWRTKNPQLWVKFGVLRNEYDSNIVGGSIGFTLLMTAVFKLFSPDLAVARYAAVTASVLSLLVLYRLARRVTSRETALLVVVASAVTLHQVTYARMAIIEAFGVFWSMLAIYWLVTQRDRLSNQALSLGFAVVAVLTKPTFAFTLGTVALVLALRAADDLRRGHRRTAARTVACIVVAFGVAIAVRAFVRHLFPEEAIIGQYAVADRFRTVSLERIFLNEFRAFTYVATSFNWRVLFAVLAIGLVWMAARRWSGKRVDMPPEVQVVLLWLLAGVLMFGAFPYKPPRYFYFVSYAVPFVALAIAEQVTHAHGRRQLSLAVVLVIVAMHALSQLPAYRAWYWRGGSASFTEMASTFATQVEREVERDSAQIVVMGPASSVLSLFGDRIRPTEFGPIAAFPVAQSRALIGRDDDMCTRVGFWRPRYTVGPESKMPRLAQACPHLVEAEEEIGRRQVMEHYYYKSDFVLRRVKYRSEASR